MTRIYKSKEQIKESLLEKVIESNDFRWTFFENFQNAEQETVLARAKYERRYILNRKRKFHYGEHNNTLNRYVKFLNKMINELNKTTAQ